jgi:hypothetical protein
VDATQGQRDDSGLGIPGPLRPVAILLAVALLCGCGYLYVGRAMPQLAAFVTTWLERRAYPGCIESLDEVEIGWTTDELDAHLEGQPHVVVESGHRGAMLDDAAEGAIAAECRRPNVVIRDLGELLGRTPSFYDITGGPDEEGDRTQYTFTLDARGHVAEIDVQEAHCVWSDVDVCR